MVVVFCFSSPFWGIIEIPGDRLRVRQEKEVIRSWEIDLKTTTLYGVFTGDPNEEGTEDEERHLSYT